MRYGNSRKHSNKKINGLLEKVKKIKSVFDDGEGMGTSFSPCKSNWQEVPRSD